MGLTAALAFLLACAPAFSQTSAQQVGPSNFAGLNDTDAPAIIEDSEAQAALNVEANLQGNAIRKRRGFQQIAALPVSTAPVSGAYQYIDPNGNSLVIVCQDRNCSKSVNGGAFSIFYATATSSVQRWSFVDINGIVYGVNDKYDQPWSYNGTTFTQPFSTSVPNGSLIELSKDRMIISGVTAFPNRVYYSQSGVYTNFNTGSNSNDPWYDDFGTPGDKVTALKYDGGNLYIFKRTSITMCILADQYATQCYPVSSTIGTNSPASIVTAPDGIYFQAQSGAFWRIPYYGIYGVEPVSKRISNLIKSQPSQFGGVVFNYQGSVTDWAAGTQSPSAAWNYLSVPGSIFPSSFTIVEQSTAVWSGASTTTCAGLSCVGYSTTTGFAAGQWFVDSGFEAGLSTGGWTYNTASRGGNGYCGYNSYGSFTWGGEYVLAGGGCGTPASVVQYINIVNANTNTVLYSTTYTYTAAVECTYKSINLSTQSVSMKVVIGQSAPSSSVLATSPSFSTGTLPSGTLEYGQGARWPYSGKSCVIGYYNAGFFDFAEPYFVANSTYTSQEYDTAYTTPTWGPLGSSVTAGGNSYQFFTLTSTASGGPYDNPVTLSTGTVIASAKKRFIKYGVNFKNVTSSSSAKIGISSIPYASTGAFVTQCIQPGSGISSWGLLSCATSTSGNGGLVFYATSAATCAGLPSGSQVNPGYWTVQSNNYNLTIATNAAVAIRFDSSLTSSTDTAQVNSCTLNWSNGGNPQGVFGVYDTVSNAMYWSTANNSLGKNNRVLKYDLNLASKGLNPWFPWTLGATAMRFVNNSLYFGSSSSGTWNQYGAGPSITSDNGAAIQSYWQSKDYSCNAPFQNSDWVKSYVVAKNQLGGTLTQTLTTSLGGSDSYGLSMSTSAAQSYVRANHAMNVMSPAPFANVQFSDNLANNPWEVDGVRLECFPYPPSMENP